MGHAAGGLGEAVAGHEPGAGHRWAGDGAAEGGARRLSLDG